MELPFVVAIVAIVFIGAPAVVLHYMLAFRKTRGLSSDDERLLDDLWRTAQSLEKRVETLESILDQEAPNWREKHV